MKSLVVHSLCLLICCWFSLLANATELELFTENFPPYNFTDNNQVKGINADIVRQACADAGITCRFNLMPWARAMANVLEMTNSGLFSTSKTAQREQQFIWVGPLVSSNACFYRLKSRTDIVINDTESLKRYSVGIARSDIYQHVLTTMGLNEGRHYLTYSNKHEDTRMFKLHKHDLIIGSSLTLAHQLEPVGLTPHDVVPVMFIPYFAHTGNYLALNKQVDADTASKMQQAIDNIKQSGQVNHIVSQYIKTDFSVYSKEHTELYQCLSGNANY